MNGPLLNQWSVTVSSGETYVLGFHGNPLNDLHTGTGYITGYRNNAFDNQAEEAIHIAVAHIVSMREAKR